MYLEREKEEKGKERRKDFVFFYHIY
jgi:hypothetical protein